MEQALRLRGTGIDTLTSHTVIDQLPPLWRRVFAALRDSGVAVEEQALAPVTALGDLQAARTPGFAPAGDGRLCLLRRHGPLDVADEVAASLAAADCLDDIVIVGADEVLDHALARHGLPRIGAHEGPPASSRLLSLVIAAAFHPMRMSDLHSLLAADPGPIPRSLAVRLIAAIRECPGRRAATWDEALAKGIEGLDDERKDEVERRAMELLMPAALSGQSLQVTALRPRLGILDSWARARSNYVPSLLQLSHRIHTLLEAVELMAKSELSWHELRRLCEDLGEPSWTWQPAQAGLAHVTSAGAVLGPARGIVWWNFSRETATRPHRLLLTRAEHEGLRAAGAESPDPSLSMAIEANGWLRALSQAREAVVLACPFTDAAGQPNHPHPLWDDVVAQLADHRDSRKLERSDVQHLARAVLARVPARPLLAPSVTATHASPITLRETESPHSIEKLLGCPMAWVLDYRARLSASISDGPHPVGPLVFGSLAHRVLEQVLPQELVSPDQAAQLAGDIFDQQASGLCEDLALPQHQAARATVRRAVVESAKELVRLAMKHGVRAIGTEVTGQVVVAGQTLKGRLDVVWDQPAMVLDLKWGKSSQVERLKTGTAIQLAAYAAMKQAEGHAAETAYFVLQNQQLLAEPAGRLAAEGAFVPGRQRASEIWSAAVATLQRRRDSLGAGQVEAPGAGGEDVAAVFSPNGLTIAPPCTYCRFAGLCGRGHAR
jgi:RecB family exonuclease